MRTLPHLGICNDGRAFDRTQRKKNMTEIISSLPNKAILVRLSRSMYQPYIHDNKVTQNVETSSGVHGAGRFNKRLFKHCTQLAECNSLFNAVYVYYMDHTVPWLDDGVRMLPNDLYFEFAKEMRDRISKALLAADRLEQNWDKLVQEDMHRLGPLANAADYPTASTLRSKYDVDLKFFPIPTTGDFRIAISEEDKEQLEKAIHDAEANVSKYLLMQLLDPVKSFVDKMAIPIGDKGSVFRNTLIENLTDVVNRLPRLNINQDEEIRQVIEDIKNSITAYAHNPDVLRESPITRKKAREDMEAIAKKMAAYTGV
jgi:hypothetical protein